MKDKKQNSQKVSNEMTPGQLHKEVADALAGLDDMKEWIDSKPEILDFINKEPSKGVNKLKQLLEDARRDTNFTSIIAEISKTKPNYDPEELDTLFTLHVLYKLSLKKFREEHLFSDNQHELKKALCENYGVDPFLLDYLIYRQKTGQTEGSDFAEEASGDMCRVVESKEEEIEDIHTFHTDIVENLRKLVFPVTLSIHKYASKRDVIDFIDKNWTTEVEPFLEKKVIKSRKLPRRVIDFIWSLKDLKSSEIAIKLREKYPEHSLAYPDINQALSEERKRRNVE